MPSASKFSISILQLRRGWWLGAEERRRDTPRIVPPSSKLAPALQGKSPRNPFAQQAGNLFLSFFSFGTIQRLRKLALVRQWTELAPTESAESRAPDRLLSLDYTAQFAYGIYYPISILARLYRRHKHTHRPSTTTTRIKKKHGETRHCGQDYVLQGICQGSTTRCTVYRRLFLGEMISFSAYKKERLGPDEEETIPKQQQTYQRLPALCLPAAVWTWKTSVMLSSQVQPKKIFGSRENTPKFKFPNNLHRTDAVHSAMGKWANGQGKGRYTS